ncbi:segregation/condensation protein A [Streptomyces sp. JH14]|uniref:segregation and condensation protein A n=1 Tax=Streptomyces sp. JH14 TaxID=2793630 RepID=UPI0023F82BC3|nr:segregation/condensation protein A [Streptomyces sp. JH14]MDF6041607.1 segregation/condensation protein A [Streptomyces sp. JH14]
MPTTDEPARTPRRPLGRGPGGRPSPGAGAPAADLAAGEREAAGAASPATPLADAAAVAPDAVEPSVSDAGVPAGDAGVPVTTVAPSAAGPGASAVDPGPSAVGPDPSDADAESGPASDRAAPADDGRFTVRLANFEGPFDLLLQLISKHKLDVTEVALSKVTDEFMAHIRAMGADWDLDQTTEFLVVAATLLDLKAARLLPAAEVEDEADLALLEARDLLFARLLQYRAYKRIAEIFSARLESEGRRFPRTVGLEPHHAELLPEVVISIGAEGFARLAVKAMQPKPKPQVYVDHIHAPLVSVREQAEIVVARLREAGEMSFRGLTEDATDTLTVVARFLALLELYREKAVTLDQEEALGELRVRWAGGEGAEPAVTDEFDQEVQDMDVQEDVQA